MSPIPISGNACRHRAGLHSARRRHLRRPIQGLLLLAALVCSCRPRVPVAPEQSPCLAPDDLALYNGLPLEARNVPTFDSFNRPYTRSYEENSDTCPGSVWTLRGAEWQGLPFVDDIQEHYSAQWGISDPDNIEVNCHNAGFVLQPYIVFDCDDHAYTALSVGVRILGSGQLWQQKYLLLYSVDYCTSWHVYEMPVSVPDNGEQRRYCRFVIETAYSRAPLPQPPAILLFEWNFGMVEGCPEGYGIYGPLYLFTPVKVATGLAADADGVLVDNRILVSANCLQAIEQGSSNLVMTDVFGGQARTYVVWVEPVMDEQGLVPSDCRGQESTSPSMPSATAAPDPCQCFNYDAPTYVRVYDHATADWVESPVLLTAPPGEDPNDYPSSGHPRPTNDPHVVPGIVMDAGGYVHVVTAAHGGAFYHLKSEAPRSVNEWTDATSSAVRSTYMSLVTDGENLHLVYRESAAQGDIYLTSQRWDASLGGWQDPVRIVCPPFAGAYHFVYFSRLSVDRSGRLYEWFRYDPEFLQREVALVASDDGGDTWYLVTTGDFGPGM